MIKVSMPNLKTVIRQIEASQKSIKAKNEELLDALAEKGSEIMTFGLAEAVYDGDMYADVIEPIKEDNQVSIGIKGESVTFIEFGTGTFYPDDHPLMDEFGYERGTFGKGLGANPPWTFRNEGGKKVTTFGNPANRVVYETGKELREIAVDIAKEVYSK